MKDDGKNTPHDFQERQTELATPNQELCVDCAEFQESLAMYRDLFETAPVGYLVLDQEGRVLEANLTMARLLETERSLLVGRAFADCIAAADREAFHGHLQEVFKAWRHRTCDARFHRKEGQELWLQLDSLPVQDEAGRKLCRIAATDVSFLKREKEILRKREVKYRSLFENMQEGVAVCRAINDGEDFVFTDFNRAAEQITKISKEDLIGRSVFEIFPGVREQGLFDAFQKVFKTGQPERSRTSIYRDKRICIWFDNSLFKLPCGDIVAVFSDQTERKQAEEALRESEEKYRALVETMNEGLAAIDGNGLFTFVNGKFCEMVGYSPDELIGQPGTMILDPRNQELARKQWDARREGRIDPYELVLTHRAGSRIYVLVAPMAVFDDSRRYMGSVGVFTDISAHKRMEEDLRNAKTALEREVRRQTADLSLANERLSREIGERKRSEEILRRSEDRYRMLSQEFDTLLNAISDTLILLSPDLRVLWANRGTAYQVDVPIGELIGRHCHNLFYDRCEPCDNCPTVRSFISGKEETQIFRDGGKFLDKRAFPILDGDKVNSVILLTSDITEKMTIQAEAMQAAHLASLGELAAGVAHEINNPINGIINYAQVLINECRPESLETDIGSRIVKEGERIADIVKSLLSFTRGSREDKWPTRMDAVLRESLVLTQAQLLKDSIRLSTKLPDDLPAVNANFQQMQQVFLNIINNARYALNEKYPSRHENKAMEILAERILLDGREVVRLTFTDQGIGVPADRLPMLTTPFFSTKPLGKGTGLGLSISQKIVTDHGGRLAFESVEGESTRVIVELPVKGHGDGQNSCSR